MPLIYAESDIGLFPNRCEGGNNMVMSEYMASGRTVIASDRTGHADVITPENAFCLTEYNPVTAYIDGYATGIWPEASVEELVALLESAYQNRTTLQQKGEVAARDMARLTWSAAAQQFHTCASALATRPPLRTPVEQPVRSEQHRIADSLFSLGFYPEAETHYRQLLEHTPLDPAVLNSLATVLNKQRRLNEALAYYHKALALQPQQHQLRYNLANTLAEIGQVDEAIAELQQVVSAEPEFADAWQNLGHYQNQQGNRQSAIQSFRQVVTLRPDRREQWLTLARLHEENREFSAAVSCLDSALDIQNNDISTLNNRGLLLHELGELDAATASYTRALECEPDNPAVCNNLGNICKSRRMMHEAISWYDRALEHDPDNATIIFNRALIFLALGDCTGGWQGFERRFDRIPPVVLPHKDIPQWSGEPLNARRLLIQSEQVYGDTFMFARFVPLAAGYGGPVVFECQDRSVQSALGSLKRCCEAVIVRGEPLPDIDLQIPLLSLPRLFNVTLNSIPASGGYLTTDPARTAVWRQTISLPDHRLKVGLVWGGRKAPLNADRSMMLNELEPLLQLPGIQFFSLQVGDDASQLTDYPDIADLGTCLHDFGETAAAISALDLVITIDSAVAHLAGALGTPVWVMLKYSPDWRWLLDRNDSPWYASARLFRQQTPGDWHPVTTAVAENLKKYAADKKYL
jgi:tetratricopeptide (TPR) repeat protein